MTKNEVADALSEIAVLLELKGENPFKVRAYQAGARVIEGLEREAFETLVTGQGLESVKGIGTALAAKIAELHASGRLEFLDNLRSSVEPGLLELLTVPGLGPKKILALRAGLGVTTLAGLQEACVAGRVEGLPGFGEKSQQNILAGIRNREAYGRRHLGWVARRVAEPILAGLRALPGVRRAEAAGSLRRCLETVGDLDFLVAAEDPGPVAAWFTAQPRVEAVTARGSTKSSVRLESGLQADLRIVPEAQFAFALHHFTGSKDHNVQMRQRALERGLSLSEWGLFPAAHDHPAGTPPEPGPLKDGPGPTDDPAARGGGAGSRSSLAARSEAEIFSLLGLAFIPPELREGLGEIEAAERGTLPRLIELSDLRGAFHNHTTASDGANTLAEMAEAAEALGWEYLGISDHSKSSRQARGLDESRLAAQVAEIRALNASGRFRVRVFAGTECDILADGSLDFDDGVLAGLDYVVASVHSGFGQDEGAMTARIVRAVENPRTTILGHATGRLLLRREPYALDLSRVIDAAIANRVAVELNANPERLDLDWRFWRRAAERGLQCFINPDAHETIGLAHVREGVQAARKGWLSSSQVVNTRSRPELEAWLADRGGAR